MRQDSPHERGGHAGCDLGSTCQERAARSACSCAQEPQVGRFARGQVHRSWLAQVITRPKLGRPLGSEFELSHCMPNDNAKDKIDHVADKAKDLADKAGTAVKDGADTVGSKIKDGADAVGSKIKDAGKAVEKKLGA